MLSPEEVKELKALGIHIDALTDMIKSQYALLQPTVNNIYYTDPDKKHNDALNSSILKITNYAKEALNKSKLQSAEAYKQ